MKVTKDIGVWTGTWLLLWSTLAYIDFFGIGGISLDTYFFILSFIVVFITCYLIAKAFYRTPLQKTNIVNYKFIKILFVIVTCIYIPILYKSLVLMTNGNIWEYRAKAFGSNDEASILFGNQNLRILYTIFIEGGVYFIQFAFLSLYLLTGKKSYLFKGFVLIFVMSIVMLGRSPIYYYALLVIFTIIYRSNGKLSLKVPILASILACVLFFLSAYRAGGEITLSYFIDKYIVGYHLYGFSLFEKSGGANSFFATSSWFGQATLGSFSYLLLYPFSKILSINFLYFNSQEYLLKNSFIVLNNGDEANAFYTIFYDMYQDFSWGAPLIYGSIFGIVYGIVYKKAMLRKDLNSFMLMLFFLNVTFGMIFRNPLATNGFVGFFFYFLLYILFNKIMKKRLHV
ncbi:O-antigen polymerase [Superficieibacter sp. HKU1]|uniref:O-antigen polymerase n=1 Tax=Superficieibacter sp. HKU1 TaxID=3031919 RepID=UPI0023E1BED4|nr:O-antigen polymerase [Superficieibacter sp. HKU1]WES66720.1 O-antigen ligase [Superficieibacter sp. HKU1]